MSYPGGDPRLHDLVRIRHVELLDGDVAVQQFVASSPNACRGPATDQPGQPIAARQQGNGLGIRAPSRFP
jgi:hypothetical protein